MGVSGLVAPVADHAGNDEGVGKQVAAKDGQTHHGDAISDAWVRVTLFAECFGQDAPVGHWLVADAYGGDAIKRHTKAVSGAGA